MARAWSAFVALGLTAGCVARSTEPVVVNADTFAGAWQSVTPSLEFVRLTVVSKSSEQGVLAARLTFSGTAWEGNGRIDADSLVVGVAISGAAQPTGTLVARARDGNRLTVRMRPEGANPIELAFVRQD